MYGDPATLHGLAGRVSAEADRTRIGATRAGDATGVAWQSLGADRFRHQLAAAVQQAQTAALQLDELAQALQRHAWAVERQLELIADAQRWLLGQVDHAWSAAHGAEATAQRLLGQAVHGVQHVASEAANAVQATLGDAADAARRARQEADDLAKRAQSLQRAVDGLPRGDLLWLDAARARGWHG